MWYNNFHECVGAIGLEQYKRLKKIELQMLIGEDIKVNHEVKKPAVSAGLEKA